MPSFLKETKDKKVVKECLNDQYVPHLRPLFGDLLFASSTLNLRWLLWGIKTVGICLLGRPGEGLLWTDSDISDNCNIHMGGQLEYVLTCHCNCQFYCSREGRDQNWKGEWKYIERHSQYDWCQQCERLGSLGSEFWESMVEGSRASKWNSK